MLHVIFLVYIIKLILHEFICNMYVTQHKYYINIYINTTIEISNCYNDNFQLPVVKICLHEYDTMSLPDCVASEQQSIAPR